MRTILVLLCSVLASPVFAQSFYSTDEGSGMIHELYPGVQQATGPLNGMAVEIMPGVTRYSYQDRDGTPRTGQRTELWQREPGKPQAETHKLDLFNEKPAPWDIPLFQER